jgi:hypothetical protein
MNRECRDRSSLIQSFLDVGDYAETSWTLPTARPIRRPRAEVLESGNEVQGPYQLVRDSRVAGLRVYRSVFKIGLFLKNARSCAHARR